MSVCLFSDSVAVYQESLQFGCSIIYHERIYLYYSNSSFCRNFILDIPNVTLFFCRCYLAVASRSELSSKWESTSRAIEQVQTEELLSPSNSHIKREEIELSEIKLDSMDSEHGHNVSNSKYLTKEHCVKPEDTDTELQTLAETVDEMKRETDIKSEEIEEYDLVDPAHVYFVSTSQHLLEMNNINKKECSEIVNCEVDKETFEETVKEIKQENEIKCEETVVGEIQTEFVDASLFDNISSMEYINYQLERNTLAK